MRVIVRKHKYNKDAMQERVFELIRLINDMKQRIRNAETFEEFLYLRDMGDAYADELRNHATLFKERKYLLSIVKEYEAVVREKEKEFEVI